VRVDATSKKRAFEEAGLLFENLHGLSRALVTDSLFARERLGSTGLGHGVAIPHGRIKGLKAPMAACSSWPSRLVLMHPTSRR
jgi:PTS system nitrogen regulatory IIA component